jgi:RNA ligase
MTHINKLIDDADLIEMIAAGYVRAQRHPTQPLTIYNYTPKTQYEKFWNDVTKQCRGLIVHDDGTVVARPFPKFFNWGEVQVKDFNMDAMVTVTDKADGSLGILYRDPRGMWSIATRGSFSSEQALEGTLMLEELYPGWEPPTHLGPVTVLFEIIYPGNRIVLDYSGKRELRLIEALWIERGWPLASDPTVTAKVLNWPGHLGTAALKVALARMVYQRKNAEGVVIRFLDTDDRYKIKQDDYVALHRVLTGTSARTIWTYLAVNACKGLIQDPKHWGSRLGIDPKRAVEILAVGPNWLDRMLGNVPDEFYDWVQQTMIRIQDEVTQTSRTLVNLVMDAKRQAILAEQAECVGARQRMYHTLRAMSLEHHGAAMALWDGKDVTTYCWKSAYPGVENPFMTQTEDVA